MEFSVRICFSFVLSSWVFRAAHLCRRELAGWSSPRGTNAAGTQYQWHCSRTYVRTLNWSCHVETQVWRRWINWLILLKTNGVVCHEALDRAVATGREECESERGCKTTPFVFSNKPVYSAHSNSRFDMTRSVQCSRLRSTMSLISSPPPRSFLEVTTSPPALSYRDERHENSTDNTKEKQIRTQNTTHYNASTYIWLGTEPVSASGQITWTNKVTDLHIAGPKPPVSGNQPNSHYSDESGILWASEPGLFLLGFQLTD